MLKEDTKRVGL